MIYLNNGASTYPKPREVIDRVLKYITSVPRDPSRSGFSGESGNVTSACREKLATLFNVKNPSRIVFTSGSTEALNLAIKGLNLAGHIITTTIEHNSVIRPLKHLEREGKITLSFVDCDRYGYVKPEDIKREIKEDTAAIVVNHSSNVTGSLLDLKSISEISGEITFIVDGSQSAGSVPIDISGWNIDIFAFTGHKSLYGLPGIGGLYIKEGIDLKPLKVGGTGVKSDLLYQPRKMPLYYEGGTQNLPGIISLSAGVDFILKTGINKIKERKERLVHRLISELKKIPEIIIYGTEDRPSALFCFNIKGMKPEDVSYILESSFEIIVRHGLHCAPLIHKSLGSYPEGSLRVSPSFFTTFDEIDYFLDSIKQIAKVIL